MGSIIPFLRDGIGLRDSVFEPHEIKTMSVALDEVCEALNLHNDITAKQIMAARIIDLVRCGERSTKRLRDRVLYEAGLAEEGQGRSGEAVFPEGTNPLDPCGRSHLVDLGLDHLSFVLLSRRHLDVEVHAHFILNGRVLFVAEFKVPVARLWPS